MRPDILLGLIWIQTVCKDYQQTTLVNKELKKGGFRKGEFGMLFFSLQILFLNYLFQKIFQQYHQNVKQFGSSLC